MVRIKLKMDGRGPGVVVNVENLDAESVRALACTTFSLPAADLFVGFPPRPIAPDRPIANGDCVEVRLPPPPPPSLFALSRFRVPGDNSCLFHSFGFCLYGGAVGAHSPALRAEVAREVLANGAFWTEVVLGRANADYAAYIERPTTWGGATELLILSKKFGVEARAVEIRSGVCYCFNEGAPRAIYFLYDGCHYDALVVGDGAAEGARLLPAAEARFKESALAVAAAERASRSFVDVGALQLRCVECGFGAKGGEDAMAHAKDTGHVQFAEWK